MYKALFIFPSILRSNSPNGQLQRAFVESLPHYIDFRIICLDGDIVVSNHMFHKYVVVKQPLLFFFIEKIICRLKLDAIFNLPDFYRYWFVPKAYKLAKRIHCLYKFQYIHSISFPCSAHIVGLKLKKKYGISWIAQFYDPWVGNPHRKVHSIFQYYDVKLEKRVANNADYVAHNNSWIIDQWSEKYCSEIMGKVIKLPLATKCSNYGNTYKINREKITFVHVGNLYKERNSIAFIKAMYSYLNKKPDDCNKIEVIYVGNVSEEEKKLINNYGLGDVFNLIGVVSEQECEFFYSEADIFLIFDVISDYNFFFPSKLLKYYYNNKPIFGVTFGNSVLLQEMKNSRHCYCDILDVVYIEQYIATAINNYDSLLCFDKEYYRQYTLSSVIKQYCELINKLLQ